MQQCSSADRSILFTTRIVRSVEHNKERFKCFPKANSKNWSCCFFLSARSHYSASPISPPKAAVVVVKTEAMAAKAVKVEMAASKPADKRAKARTAVVAAIKVAVVAEIMVAAPAAAKVEMVAALEAVKVEMVAVGKA